MCGEYITSVHDTAEGFGGVGLRKGQAEIAQRIRDALHGPDDTWGTGRRGYCVRQRAFGWSFNGLSTAVAFQLRRKWQEKLNLTEG